MNMNTAKSAYKKYMASIRQKEGWPLGVAISELIERQYLFTNNICSST